MVFIPCAPVLLCDFFRNHVWLAVLAPQEGAGFAIADERFLSRIHLQGQTERELVFVNIDSVRFQMSGHAFVSLGGPGVALSLFWVFFGTLVLAEPIGDVAGVAESAGK